MTCNLKNILKSIFVVSIFVLAGPLYAKDAPNDAIIAIVNDDVVTLKDLRQYIASIASQLRVENKTPDEIQQIMGEYEQKGLDKLIEDKLILAAANDKGIDVRDELIDKRIQEIKGRYPSEDDFIKALNTEGMTVGDLRQKLFVKPEDVTAYYNDHLSDFNHNPSVNLQSVFVAFDKYSKQVARTRADEARSRLLAGEDFDKVSQEYSNASSVGEIEKGQMVDSIEKVVFNLKLGDISEPVEVENGIYVFKVIGTSPAKQQTLAEVKDHIYGKLLDDQFQAKFKEWVAKLREKAYVEIK